MTKSKKRQQSKHKKHYRISRKKLIKRGRKGQTGGNVSRFLPDVRLVNMIPQRSVAFVLAHGCILGTEAAGMRVARRFVLPNNVNIITLASLNKYIDTPRLKSGFRVEDELTDDISQNSDNLFEHDNMGSNPTSGFKQYCQMYFSKYFTHLDPDKKNPGLFDIQNPDGILHVRNHIYPSEINDALVGSWERGGSISIFSNGESVKFDSYETLSGQHSLLELMPISVLLCYLFGKEEMQEIITLPHLTVILHTCRQYCNEADVTSVTDDTVYSAAADAHAARHVMLGLTLSPGDEVLITGTSNLDLNTRIGVVEERTANEHYGVRISEQPPKSFAMANLRKIVRMSMASPPPPDTVVLYRLNTDRNKTSSGKVSTADTLLPGTVLIQDCYSYEHVAIPNDDVYIIF